MVFIKKQSDINFLFPLDFEGKKKIGRKSDKISKTAQMFSLDMIIALGVFVVILLASASAWDNARERIYLQEQRNDLEFIARNAMSSLILTPGEPDDWYNLPIANFDEINVKSLGLTDGVPYRLKIEKAQYLEDATIYEQIKRILGILGPGYEFFLDVSLYDGLVFYQSYLIGVQPDGSEENVVVVERTMEINGEWAVVRLKVWQRRE